MDIDQFRKYITAKSPKKALTEASYQIYHSTYSAALQHALDQVRKQGYTPNEDDWFNNVSTAYPGKPSVGKTSDIRGIRLEKDGQPTRKGLQIQIYAMESGKYELTFYVS